MTDGFFQLPAAEVRGVATSGDIYLTCPSWQICVNDPMRYAWEFQQEFAIDVPRRLAFTPPATTALSDEQLIDIRGLLPSHRAACSFADIAESLYAAI
jgi:hypothetical protein